MRYERPRFLHAGAILALALSGYGCNFIQGDSIMSSRKSGVKVTPVSNAPPNQNEYEIPVTVQNGYATVREAGVLFTFKAADYGRVAMTKVEKSVTTEPSPEGSWPEHHRFHLEDKRPLPAFEKGPRYFFPARSLICFIPLGDPSEKEFGKTYPEISSAAAELRQILSKRLRAPDSTKSLPDLPLNNAGQSIRSKAQLVDFKAGSGILFLTQYTQEVYPNPINNEELTCNFQGLTKDGKYYVAARMAITHPSLPRGIDFTKHIDRDDKLRYLKAGEKGLNRLADDSFQPSLAELKKLIASISIQ